MKHKLRAAAIVSFITVLSLGVNFFCGADQLQESRTFIGTVLETDWVGSVMTVEGVEGMTFSIGPETKVMQGTEPASFADIEQGDYVAVKYYEDPSGDARAVRVDIEKPYPIYN